jgi:hypothetical protein
MAAATSSGDTRPRRSTPSRVISQPSRSSRLQVSSTDLCSVTWVTTWRPASRYASATPLIARLFASVAPAVKTTSREPPVDSSSRSAPRRPATALRARLTARSAAQPNGWALLAALPKTSEKYGRMASNTRGSIGVVALWSR